MGEVINLLFAGVGGQGSLLSAELTSLAATHAGHDVKQTEVHGVSQRGGSVETHVRYGEDIHSPVVTPGEADVVIGLEKLEALRFAHFVNPADGTIIINDFEIIPGSISKAKEIYPYHAVEFLEEKNLPITVIPASHVARELGDERMTNVVMLGALSTLIKLPEGSWQHALNVRLPEKYLEANLRAYEAGKGLIHED